MLVSRGLHPVRETPRWPAYLLQRSCRTARPRDCTHTCTRWSANEHGFRCIGMCFRPIKGGALPTRRTLASTATKPLMLHPSGILFRPCAKSGITRRSCFVPCFLVMHMPCRTCWPLGCLLQDSLTS